jgi:hypothetical protein
MMKPHDFVGPFYGAAQEYAVNLALIEAATNQPDNKCIKLYGAGGDPSVYTFTFKHQENYDLAHSILVAKGVLPKGQP